MWPLSKKTYITIVIISIVNISMLFIRNKIENDNSYNFFLFNLFLGFIPLLLALLTSYFHEKIKLIGVVILSALWLLFFPNSPYMITDLIHVKPESNAVIYDELILFSISLLSLFYGFYSLKIIHNVWTIYFNKKIANLLAGISVLLSSLGLYMGRILRINSWDIFHDPFKVIGDVFDHLWPINENPTTYYLIIIFSFIQISCLFLIKDFDSK